MSQSRRSKERVLTQTFGIILGITIAVWLLRGFGLVTFIPGGIIWMLILLSLVTGILSRLRNMWWRF